MDICNMFDFQEEACASNPTSVHSLNGVHPNLKKRKYATPECPPVTEIWNLDVSSKASGTNSQVMKSSKMLTQGSTGIGGGLKPFWTEYSKELSLQLWLSTATSSVALPKNSWFSTMTTVRTCPPSPPSLWPAIRDAAQLKIDAKVKGTKLKSPKKKIKVTEVETTKPKGIEIEKVPAGKCLKVRLCPSKAQSATLLQWFGAARWTYNQCVAYWRNKELKDKKFNKKHLRSLFLNESAAIGELKAKYNSIFDSTPYDIRNEGMNDFLKAMKTSKALLDNGHINHYGFKYRTKRDVSQSIVIHHKHWKNSSCYTSFRLGEIRTSEPLPDKSTMKYDMRIVLDNLGHFYLCIPKPLELRGNSHVPASVISLDPGVRTFQTGYDPSGKVIEFAKGDKGRLVRLCHHTDNLQSKMDLCTNARRKRRMKVAFIRMQHRVRNLVNEMHKKVVSFLVNNYHIILLPEFNTSQMVIRGSRKIRSKTVRSMLTWSHYRFKQRLLHKTREHVSCSVLIVTEEYTSKTCGKCGFINQKLGGSKVFKCPQCCTTIDRDLNGARNILLKFLTENRQQTAAEMPLGLSPSLDLL